MMSSHDIIDRLEAAGTWKVYCPTPRDAPSGRQVESVSAWHFGGPARSGLAERRALAITRRARDGHGSCRTAKDVVHSRHTEHRLARNPRRTARAVNGPAQRRRPAALGLGCCPINLRRFVRPDPCGSHPGMHFNDTSLPPVRELRGATMSPDVHSTSHPVGQQFR